MKRAVFDRCSLQLRLMTMDLGEALTISDLRQPMNHHLYRLSMSRKRAGMSYTRDSNYCTSSNKKTCQFECELWCANFGNAKKTDR